MSREKQIEEMAREIETMYHCKGYADDRGCYFANSCIACKNANREKSIEIAERLTDKGYRKEIQGEWEIVIGSNGKEKMVCTNCRHQQDLASTFTYCPNCGAKMKGE